MLRAGLLLALVFVVLFLGPTSPPLGLWLLIVSLVCATVYPFFFRCRLSRWLRRLPTTIRKTDTAARLPCGGVQPRHPRGRWYRTDDRRDGERCRWVSRHGCGHGRAHRSRNRRDVVRTRGVKLTRDEQSSGRLSEHMKIMLRNRDAAMLVMANVIQGVAVSMVPYQRHRLRCEACCAGPGGVVARLCLFRGACSCVLSAVAESGFESGEENRFSPWPRL